LPGFSSPNRAAKHACQPRALQNALPDFPMEFVELPWDFERAMGHRPFLKIGSAVQLFSNGS
jgi:hypothetical protein